MTETIAAAALICCCAVLGVLAGRDIPLNWRSTDADNFQATAHLKGRTGAVAAAVCAPLLALVSWPGALFALAVGVFCLFVPSNRAVG